MGTRFQRCNCPAGLRAAAERHAPDCPGRSCLPSQAELDAAEQALQSLGTKGQQEVEVKLKPTSPETVAMLAQGPACYLAGMYRPVIKGDKQPSLMGAQVSFVNLSWPDQIELFTKEQLLAVALPSGIGVAISVEQLKKIHRELDACQKVIHYAGGFDPAYVNDAQEQLKVIEDILAMVKKQ